ncbi:flagellar basal-body rod protein FlgG [Anaerotignum neopropionicum]|uniref:Flagellar basal-body rod protein FlgG n=1 Tax=Anaerotignum neopropionicum TaxID=36847 RepID=A0A136WJB7_9FIRM|nr:flagellar hook-basal body protein [Anaerotignum neopropionicum]KXL54555.1 flagellar basal-body rod protein FlgG [Anaerotignum neopropionicum]
MEMSFYNGRVGAAAQQTKLDVVANNIANVNTAGYKSKSLVFSDLLYNNMAGIDGKDSNVKSGSGVKPEKTNISFEKGSVNLSGSQLDFSIEGRGFFVLQNPQTKEYYYTTSGSFVLSEKEDGFYLASKDGNFVIGASGDPIIINAGDTTDGIYDKDGNLLEGTAIALKDAVPIVVDFPKTEGLLSIGDSNFIATEKNGAPFVVDANVTRGSFEGSNVDIANEFAKAIEAQRAYQYSIRMVQTTDEIQNLINNLRQ